MPPMRTPGRRTLAKGPVERSTRSAAARVLVGTVAAALVLLQVQTLAHFFLVPHEFCAEHGELIHGHAEGSAAQAATREVAEAGVLDSAQAGTRHAAGHDHCPVFVHQRSRAVVEPAAEAPHPVAAAPLNAVSAERAAPASVAVLFFAPKNSPPA